MRKKKLNVAITSNKINSYICKNRKGKNMKFNSEFGTQNFLIRTSIPGKFELTWFFEHADLIILINLKISFIY